MNNIQRITTCIVGFTTFIGLVMLSLKFKLPTAYPDFIAGHVTWTNGAKLQDLLAMPIAIAGTIILIFFLVSLFEKINSLRHEDGVENATSCIALWTIPALASIFSTIQINNFSSVIFGISITGIIFLLLSYLTILKKEQALDANAISAGLVGIFFLGLIPLDVAILAKFGLPGFQNIGGISEKKIETIYLTLVIIFLLGYLFLLRRKKHIPYKEISTIIFLGQLTLPLLYASLYPAKMQDPLGNIHSYNVGIGLKLVIAGMIIAAAVDVFYRYLRHGSTDSFSIKIVSPLAICALLVSLKAGTTTAPTLSPDDYHFGEYLLGGWVYLQGYIPYIDYIPPHGIIHNDLSGLINVIFYDGTAGSLGEAQRFTLYLLSTIAFLSVYYFTGSVFWSFLSVFFLGARISWLFFLPFIALWFHRSLIENKVKWTIIWFATAPVVILGIPPQGLLLVIASGVIPLYFLTQAIIAKDWRAIKIVSFSAIVAALFYLITPLGTMLYHAIKYVLVNGPINQAAYGVPWSLSFSPNGILAEAIRMSWVLVPLVAILILHSLYRKKNFQAFLVLPLCVIIILSFLLIPYSMGRIDPGSTSRPGIIGILLIAGVMGFALWNSVSRYNRIWLFFGMVIFSALLKFAYFSHLPLLNAANGVINIGHVVDTKNTDLKNIGTASLDGTQWNRIKKLSALMNDRLEAHESYLDATSRNAQYFYLNRKPTTPVTAPYNMVSLEQQREAISILEVNLPRLALLEADNITHDGGGLAMRSHHLYRYLIEQYEPMEIDGFIIGLSKSALARGDWNDVPAPSNAEKMIMFEKSFSRLKMNLERLPTSWGNSIKSLEEKMSKVADLTSITPALNDVEKASEDTFNVKGGDPYTWYDISDFYLSGKSAGILKFEFECVSKSQQPFLQVFWWGDEQVGAHEEFSVVLTGSTGTLLVPLDTSPRWLLLHHIKGLRIDLSNSNACASYSIKNLSLHQRKLGDL